MISIAMATYNGEKYIREQLDSVISQSFFDWELQVCDDCSSDSTFSILEEYALMDSRIHPHKNSTNLGFKKNFENAISFCTGDYIAFCDQDDIWHTNKLEKQISLIGDYDFVCSNAQLFISSSEEKCPTMMEFLKLKVLPDDKRKQFAHLLFANYCQGTTMLAKTQFIKSFLPIPDAFVYHDHYFAFVACVCNGFYYCEESLLDYRRHENAVTYVDRDVFTKILKIISSLGKSNENVNLIQMCSWLLKNKKFEAYKFQIQDALKYHTKKNTIIALWVFYKYYDVIYWDGKSIFVRFIRILKEIVKQGFRI